MRIFLVTCFTTFVLSLFLSSCGPSQSSYNALVEDNAKLQSRIEELEKEIDELKHGAERCLGEITNAYKNKEYEKVIELVNILEQKHPGTDEYRKARQYKEKASVAILEKTKKEKEERRKKTDDARENARDKVREIIRVSEVSCSEPNSVGGVDFSVVWQNRSNKTIKYIWFTAVPYNAVGDIVTCSIRDRSECRGKVTGPISPGQWYGEYHRWECAWYNNTIRKVKLKRIEIEYMDGSTATLDGEKVKYVIY